MEQNIILLNNILNPFEMDDNLNPQGQGDNAASAPAASFLLEHPVPSASLLPDNFIMVDHVPCQILEIPKVTLKTRNIYTGEILDVNCLATDKFPVPIVTSEYYQAIGLDEEGVLTIKMFDGDDSTQRNVRIGDRNLMDKLRLEIQKPNYDTYCTIIKAFGTERLASIKSCPTFPYFHGLPFEMLEKVFSFLPKRDLVSVRLVCRKWVSAVPISSIIRIHFMKICGGRIITRLEPNVSANVPTVLQRRPPYRTESPKRLTDFGPDLVRTVRHLELRERVIEEDLEFILEHCTRLCNLDLDYPTHETMQVLDQLLTNNEETLNAFSIWDYFWYNTERDAFDCSVLITCRKLTTLTLFVKHIKNLDTIPLGIRYLKLDKISLGEIRWIIKNMKWLKFLRFEVEHGHHQWKKVTEGRGGDQSADEVDEGVGDEEGGEMDTETLIGLCNLPLMEKLDLNFSTVPGEGGSHGSCCPTVLRFEQLCNTQEGLDAYSDTWDTSCTLEISINRKLFEGFAD